jgi:hypothetical protein
MKQVPQTRPFLRAATFLLAGVGILAGPAAANAGIIFSTSSSTSSKGASSISVQSKSHSASGNPDLQDGTSAAVTYLGGRGSDSNSISVTHQLGVFNPNDYMLFASLSNAGSSRKGSFGTSASSTGAAQLNVTFTTDQTYAFVLTDVGSASASRQRGFADSASATLSSDLFNGTDSAITSNSSPSDASFNFMRSGILAPGTYTFSGNLGGNTGPGDESSSLLVQLDLTPVPEPASLSLLTIGLAGLAGYRYRRRRIGYLALNRIPSRD